MIEQLFPQRADNGYRGHKLALWLFALLLLMKAGIGFSSMFNGYDAASSADGIPLDTFAPAAAQTVVSLFALLGLYNAMICLVGILVLVRYRSTIPLVYALLLLEHLSRKLILQLLPIPRTGAPPGLVVSLVLLAVIIVGLVLSLRNRESPRAED